MTKPLLSALGGETLSRPPFWLMRQAGRYLPEYRKLRQKAADFLEFCYTPDLAVEATLQPLRRFGMDGAILFSDIVVVLDALGRSVGFREGEGPILEPVRSLGDLDGLGPERIPEYLDPVYETLRRLSRELPPETALIGFVGAPWTLAVYLVEGRGKTDCGRVKSWASETPGEFRKVIDLLVEGIVSHMINQAKNGAEVIQLFDSWAGVLDKKQVLEWVIRPTAVIVRRFRQACPGVPVIGFPRGAGELYLDYARETGVDGVGVDSTVPLEWIRDSLQPVCTVQGNLDNRVLVAGGRALDEQTARILETLSGNPFIFNLGHGVLPETPPDHVARLARRIRDWNGA
ncbi:MAG: uroporphyrinogen decarboxylase [Proteobacteria bacterium]|nr:uroporphyrinogen decarboxylase [Pseudomonadota bacterium]